MVEAATTDLPTNIYYAYKKELDVLNALDSISAHVTTTYTKEKMEKLICTNDPEATKAEMEQIKAIAPHYAKHMFGQEFVEALTGLAEYSNSFRSIRFIGVLPANYEADLELENF